MILKLFFLVVFSFLLALSKQVQSNKFSHRKLAHFISKMQHCILSIPTLDLIDLWGWDLVVLAWASVFGVSNPNLFVQNRHTLSSGS